MDSYECAAGSIAARMRELGIRSRVGVPIVVDQRVWGMAVVGSSRSEPLPPDTEQRMGDFAELVATAIVAAATRDELIKSRGRIVAAADETRRRLERDLHDGAQQRAVSLGLQLRMAQDLVPTELGELTEQLSEIGSAVAGLSEELREISHGLHPAALAKSGLGPAIKTLARSLDAAGDPGYRSAAAIAGDCRGRRLLRGRRGVDQRRQACAGLRGHREDQFRRGNPQSPGSR